MTDLSQSESPRKKKSKVRPRILLADDHEDLRSLLAVVLRRDGYEVIEAEDGMALIESVRTCWPMDAIVTDLRMPGISGFEVMEALRSISCKVPVVVITAFGDAATHAEARRLGAAAVFDKPFEVDDLRIALAKLGRQ